MAEVKQGDTVKVHYSGRLNDGTVFDSSEGRDPLKFTIGEGQVISGFEQSVVGMNPGESVTADIPSNEAYGPHNQEKVIKIGKEQLPPNYQPEVGHRLQSRSEDGRPVVATITEVAEAEVTLDTNHPLAGKDLTFDIELVEIV